MNGRRMTQEEIDAVIKLRQTGHSFPEIKNVMKRSGGTVFRYAHKTSVLPQYQSILKAKQGGSKARALRERKSAEEKANALIPPLGKTEKLLIAACLYWGEGTKKDFSLSNTDPDLIKVFITCLEEMGITKGGLRVTVRIYEDLNKKHAISHWAKIVGIAPKQILNVNVLKGKKKGKLKYGMCRLRVTKGAPHLKLIHGIVQTIKTRLQTSPL